MISQSILLKYATLTDADDSLLQLWSRHAFQNATTDLTQVIQIGKLNGPLLDLELGACGIGREQRLYPLLLHPRCCWTRGDLCESGQNELTGEVVGVGRIKS